MIHTGLIGHEAMTRATFFDPWPLETKKNGRRAVASAVYDLCCWSQLISAAVARTQSKCIVVPLVAATRSNADTRFVHILQRETHAPSGAAAQPPHLMLDVWAS